MPHDASITMTPEQIAEAIADLEEHLARIHAATPDDTWWRWAGDVAQVDACLAELRAGRVPDDMTFGVAAQSLPLWDVFFEGVRQVSPYRLPEEA